MIKVAYTNIESNIKINGLLSDPLILMLLRQGCLFFMLLYNIVAEQGRSEGTSSVAFEVLIINCQIYFINSFIFNCLTLNIKLFIFKLFDVKFLFSENHVFRKQKRTACLWSYGRASLVSDFKLTRENDGLLSSRHK